MMEYDIHTVLDLVTLAATGWVIYAMLGPVHSSWQSDKDTLHELYVVRSLFRNVFQAVLAVRVLAMGHARMMMVFRLFRVFRVF